MKESDKHQSQINDECESMEKTTEKSSLLRSAGRLLTLIGMQKQAEETEKISDTPRSRGRPRTKK